MPVDLSIGSGIINAYLAGLEQRRKRESDAAEKQNREDVLKEHMRQFDEKQRQENEHFDKTFKADSATRALSNLQIKASLQKHIEENGALLPGMEEHIKTNTSPAEDIASLNAGTYSSPAMRGELRPGMTGPSLTREISLPEEAGGGSFSALDPISAALRDANRAQILQTPKTNELIRQHKGIAEAELPSKLALESAKFGDQTALQTQKDLAAGIRSNNTNTTHLKGIQMTNAAKMAAAKLAQTGSQSDLEDLSEFYTDGSSTKEDLPPGKPGVAIRTMLAKNGYRVLDKTDKGKLEDIGLVKQIIGTYNQLNEAYRKSSLLGMVTPEVTNLEDQSDALAGQMSRLVGGERGVLTEKDVARVKGLRPSKFNAVASQKSNDKRVNDLKDLYREKVRTIKGTMKPDQSGRVDQRFNLLLPDDVTPDSSSTGNIVDDLVKKHKGN